MESSKRQMPCVYSLDAGRKGEYRMVENTNSNVNVNLNLDSNLGLRVHTTRDVGE
jgi:hypothetical protein